MTRGQPVRAKRFTRAQLAAAIAAAAVSVLSNSASAADGTWTGTAGDLSWATNGNWLNDICPGSNAGAAGTSADTSVFNTPGTGSAILVDSNRNLKSIIFDINASTSSGRLIGAAGATDPIYLTGGGSIAVTANTNTASSNSINNPVVVLGNYTFRNDSLTTSAGLKINSSITSAAAAPTTITLDGVNYGGVLTSNTQWTAGISDGPGSPVSIVKNGTGVWDLRASSAVPNTYSGDTVLNAGAIRFNGNAALSPNSNYIVNEGATFRPSVSGTIKSLTANSAVGYVAVGETTPRATLTESGGAVVSINTTTGPALTLNLANQTGTADFGVPIALTGNVANQGGVRLIVGDSTPKITYGKNIDLGPVNRIFEINHSAANDVTGDPDLQVGGVVSGGGGLTKTGAGVLKLNNAANSFTGQLEIQSGSVRFNSSGALTGTPALLIDGGDFNVQGFTQTLGAVTATKGTISATTGTPGTLAAPSYTFNVATGDTATARAILADSSAGPSSVTKTGAGKATLFGPNTYTGPTTVQGGSLTLGSDAWTPVLGGGAGYANITHGRLIFDYTGVSSPATQIETSLQNSYPTNFSTGALRSSAADGSHGLGWGDDGTSKVSVAYVYYGDSDLSGTVDLTDFTYLAANFNKSGGVTWLQGDYNYDDKVDLTDFTFLASNFNKTIAAGAAGATIGAAVPEPSVLAAVTGLTALILRRRRR